MDIRRVIFLSYSHNDSQYLHELKTYLTPMLEDSQIDLWDDTRISPGDDWKGEISQALTKASTAILMVSPEFLASEFIAKYELPTLLNKAKSNGLKILSVVVSECLLEHSKLANFQTVNNPRKPLNRQTKPTRTKIWNKLASAIQEELDRLGRKGPGYEEQELAENKDEKTVPTKLEVTTIVSKPDKSSTESVKQTDSQRPSELIGAKRVVYAIKSRYPQLSIEMAEKYAALVITEMARRIGAGDQLATWDSSDSLEEEIIPHIIEGLQGD